MKARWLGVLTVGASLLLAAGTARAFDTGGPPLGEEQRELTGHVVSSDASTLYLEHMGSVVPVQIGPETRFFGVRSADRLVEGQEVRASLTVTDDGKNVASSISVAAPDTGSAVEPATAQFTDQG
jgi:hypothetical protein